MGHWKDGQDSWARWWSTSYIESVRGRYISWMCLRMSAKVHKSKRDDWKQYNPPSILWSLFHRPHLLCVFHFSHLIFHKIYIWMRLVYMYVYVYSSLVLSRDGIIPSMCIYICTYLCETGMIYTLNVGDS